jgi:hypothetical protein
VGAEFFEGNKVAPLLPVSLTPTLSDGSFYRIDMIIRIDM